jgi:hypothetical protein
MSGVVEAAQAKAREVAYVALQISLPLLLELQLT